MYMHIHTYIHTNIGKSKCHVIECDYNTIEGTCSNSSCSMFNYCDIHLEHASHMNHQIRLEDRREDTVSVFFLF